MHREKPNAKKSEERARLANDVAAFLSSGNEIHQVQVHENKWYRDKGHVKRAPLTITQARQEHRWKSHNAGSGVS